MNNRFEWNRFCKVVAKDFRNMWPLFGTTMVVLAALPFAVWLAMAVFDIHSSMLPDLRLIMIQAVAYLAAIMAPSRMYRAWNLRNEGIYFAMLPASKAEKYCSALLFSLIVCPLAVYLGSLALDIFLTALPFGPWRDWIWHAEMGFPFTLNLSAFSDMSASEYGAAAFQHVGLLYNVASWMGYISAVLMFLFTATLFRRHKVLQTFLWLYAIEFVLSIVLIPISVHIVGNSDFVEWFMHLPEQMGAKAMVDWAMGALIAFNALLAFLFGWFSWRRLSRMAY